jgi:diguanylate cyclase (GGDEF)-like protein
VTRTSNVVIVDDQRLNLRVAGAAAANIEGVIVHPFLRSLDALAWWTDEPCDCFVLDYRMPAPDGLEMIRRIRARDAEVPIVLVTADDDRTVVYRAFALGANDFIRKPIDASELTARLTTLLELRRARRALALRIEELEGSLRDAEERSRRHAERLETFWKAVSRPATDDERWNAMLHEAGRAIRPGTAYRGTLARLAGGELTIEAGSRRRKSAAERRFLDELVAAGGTRSVDNAGGKAFIATAFSVIRSTYVLAFAADEPNPQPFGIQDHAYVEVLASFFASNVEQRWQSERLLYQQSYDVLTGVLNRSKFRSLARLASLRMERYGIILIDICDFRELNDAHGSMIGDAMLVEVAAALRGEAAPDELVGRLGGDVFGIYIPAPQSPTALRARATALLAVFGRRFPIGDRDGRGAIALAACCGAASAPEDGATFESILSEAESALLTAKSGGPGSLAGAPRHERPRSVR